MTVYVIAYDLNKEVTRPKIVDAIHEYPFALLSESSYAIESDSSPETIFDEFREFIDNNDNLYVIPLNRPYIGYGPQEVIDWLNERLS